MKKLFIILVGFACLTSCEPKETPSQRWARIEAEKAQKELRRYESQMGIRHYDKNR